MSPITVKGSSRLLFAAALLGILFGCSTPNSKSTFDPQTGKHQANWVSTHPVGFLTDQSACTECHGSDLHGGISKVSCFSVSFGGVGCHANGPGHPNPAAWADPSQHGVSAKAAPNVAQMHGFSTCQICHGSGFNGGFSNQTCLNTAGCHGAGVMSPHPAAWLPTSSRRHDTTNEGNAPACALCHANGANSPIAPPPPAPAGTLPGCFNNTLCHGQTHPSGWASPSQHGAYAKAAPNVSTTSGFSTCQTCHASDFTGGVSGQTCLNTAGCHGAGVMSPHPANWVPGDTYVHSTTNQANADVCALCHTAGANSPITAPTPTPPPGTLPGCYNNTLCHGNMAPHVVPFTSPSLHGPAAKPDLTYCETCHASPSNGGPGSNPRFNVAVGSLTAGCESAGCHDANTAHPVPWRGLTAGETGHMTAGNMANACALCHGATLGGGVGPACTTCHTAGSPLVKTNCTSCHGNPPDGSAAPNIAGAHAAHLALGTYIVCATCHTGAGTGTANHANGTVNVAFQSAYNAKTGAAAYASASFTCSSVSCHGGQTTPNWRSGTITVNSQCTSCHGYGTAQYNSFQSGHHYLHVVDQGFACIDCHDTTKLATVHFLDLNTTAMTQAWKTILNTRSYTGTGTGYGTCSNFSCHGETHTDYQW